MDLPSLFLLLCTIAYLALGYVLNPPPTKTTGTQEVVHTVHNFLCVFVMIFGPEVVHTVHDFLCVFVMILNPHENRKKHCT